MTVAIVDDHPVVLEGVQAWLDRDPDRRVELVASGPTVADVCVGAGADADVLVVDLNLGGASAIDQIADLAARRRVVVFSQEMDETVILTVLESGASAYLTKNEGGDYFVDTVVAAAQDRAYVTPSSAGAMWADTRPARPDLSKQERTALRLWFEGMSKASVAMRMNISVHTANQYINRARIKYSKAGRPGHTKAALLARAIEDGLIRPEEVREYHSMARLNREEE
ncbi:response regulator transcription factor [Virgisporangium aurantiacum]|uniref:response regulator transcription factor n=1 Tax=Virgisporangium aurantiacum TaxID=175570 RepID=UPI001EF1C962|nr:response regulator transcription factor [Virgisporangium aurantiacum]